MQPVVSVWQSGVRYTSIAPVISAQLIGTDTSRTPLLEGKLRLRPPCPRKIRFSGFFSFFGFYCRRVKSNFKAGFKHSFRSNTVGMVVMLLLQKLDNPLEQTDQLKAAGRAQGGFLLV